MNSFNSDAFNRRKFLRYAGLFTAANLTSIGLQSWDFTESGVQALNRRSPRLIVILLRGAVDGLNVVVPYQEPAYYEGRPTIALPAPNQANGVIPLNSRFGLHPALKDLMPLWTQGNLAFVHACGSPDPSRSHFDAQYYLEAGTPGSKRLKTGWLNRLLAQLPRTQPTQAINVGNTTPLILAGSEPVASFPRGRLATQRSPLDQPQLQTAFDRLYRGNSDLSQVYRSGRQARSILMAEFATELRQASKGAPAPAKGFAQDVRRLAQLMQGNAQTQIAFVALGGWDTHINQGSTRGRLTRQLRPLGQGLAQLSQQLGSTFQDTTIVVMSEFGRTVNENGNQGTDHGHGNVMWILGGRVRGGQVYGDWPGLEVEQRYQGRDLAITTDFRDVLGSVLNQHLGLSGTQLAQIFPGHRIQKTLPLLR